MNSALAATDLASTCDPYDEHARAAVRRRASTNQGDPHAFGERAVLKSMFASLLRASKTWQRVVVSEFELRQIEDLRNELDEEFKQKTTSTLTASRRRIYSKEGT
jgi:hypothetical protein